MRQRGSTLIVVLIIIFLILIPIGTFYLSKSQFIKPATVVTSPISDSSSIVPSSSNETIKWKILDQGDIFFKYPPGYFYDNGDPAFKISNSKVTYDAWVASDGKTAESNSLMLDGVYLLLDRKLDPRGDTTKLASIDQALQREINRYSGNSDYVSSSVVVPWENANGGTYDGRKVFVSTVKYEPIIVNGISMAKVVTQDKIAYFIPNKSGDGYLRLVFFPAKSNLIDVSEQIIKSVQFK